MEVGPRPSSGPGVYSACKPDPLHRFNAAATDQPANRFEGDGRTHCSQMRSCAEAGCFLRTAPTQSWMEIETAQLVSGCGAIDRGEVWQLMQARITSKHTSESNCSTLAGESTICNTSSPDWTH